MVGARGLRDRRLLLGANGRDHGAPDLSARIALHSAPPCPQPRR
jgi:hypothetical protein